MNRRNFLKSALLALGVVLEDWQFEYHIKNGESLTDEEFILYFKACFDLYVVNPRQCAYIDNIRWDE